MPILPTYKALKTIAVSEFADVIVDAQIMSLPTGDPLKLRFDIVDGSLLDVLISPGGRYSYHWERHLIATGELYRHDNAPHERWRHVATFPKHFHNGIVRAMWSKVISATAPSKLSVKSSRLCATNC